MTDFVIVVVSATSSFTYALVATVVGRLVYPYCADQHSFFCAMRTPYLTKRTCTCTKPQYLAVTAGILWPLWLALSPVLLGWRAALRLRLSRKPQPSIEEMERELGIGDGL